MADSILYVLLGLGIIVGFILLFVCIYILKYHKRRMNLYKIKEEGYKTHIANRENRKERIKLSSNPTSSELQA